MEGLALRLPEPATLRRRARHLAVLDAVMSPDWEFRWFSFDAAWGDGEQLASMRNGSGDEWSVTFTSAGTYVRGFDHESALSPFAQEPQGLAPGLLDGLPEVLRPAAEEPAFTMADLPLVTVALWRLAGDRFWAFGAPPARSDGDDGGTWLFEQLDGRAETYRAFAAEYYEQDLDVRAIGRVFDGEPLTGELVSAINPGTDLADIADEVAAMGHPLA